RPDGSNAYLLFFGSGSLYERAGFREVVRRSPTRLVMRRGLRPRRAAGVPISFAGANLRLLCRELFLSQYASCFQLTEFLQLGDHVFLSRSSGWLRWRRRIGLLLC